jgi:hypothetical protein
MTSNEKCRGLKRCAFKSCNFSNTGPALIGLGLTASTLFENEDKERKATFKKKIYCTILQHANTEEHSGTIKASVTTPDWFLLATGNSFS